jgi:hypothetical protein
MGDKRQDLLDALELELKIVVHKMKKGYQATALLDALELELEIVERGGYEPSVREPRKELSILRDSASCLNYALEVREHPCSECWLIDFVPGEKHAESIPCHHIPLNDRGDTVASLGNRSSDPEVQEALKGWLRSAIQQLRSVSTH